MRLRPPGLGIYEGHAPTLDATAPHIVAGTVTAKWSKGTGGPAGDEVQNLVVVPDVAATLDGPPHVAIRGSSPTAAAAAPPEVAHAGEADDE